MKNKIFILVLILSTLFISVGAFESASENTSYIVIEESTGRVLVEYNKDAKLPIASTTKIVTASVVLENCDISEEVTIPNDAVGVEGSSIYLKAGDNYTVEDLLYGLMLRSGNDSAVALAIHTAGSVDAFVDLMNEKACALGAINTHFTNPHGLHDSDHYSSAYDMAILTANAYKNETFKKIVSSKRYLLKGNYIYNKNKMLSMYEGADGVKTGYTTKSGRCLVSSSVKDDMRVICVVLNCYDMWNKSISLMETAHKDYDMVTLVSTNDTIETSVIKGEENLVKGSVQKNLKYPLKQSEISKVTYTLDSYDLVAPVYKGTICANIKVCFDNRLIFDENIYTINNVKRKSILNWL